jgi:acetyl-CoA carboxylase carboxyl transferase subunit beta
MVWFKKDNPPKGEGRVKIPHGLWVKCEHCGEIIYKKEVERNLDVCPKCTTTSAFAPRSGLIS